jgi:lysophospholipase L1-like esterase
MRSPYLLLCCLAGLVQSNAWSAPVPATAPATTAAPAAPKKLPFEDEILAFEAADKKTPPPLGAVLFTGSSSIRLWSTLAQDFPELTVLNRGFGGSLVENSVQYVDRITIPYKPKMIVLYAGTNDIASGHTPAQVLKDFQEYVTKVHAALPETRIVYISINPSTSRIKQRDRVVEANNLVAQYIRDNNGKTAPLTFIDTYSFLLTPEGNPRPDIFRNDGLHLNAEGYAAWTSLLKPQILALAGVKAGATKAQPFVP